MTSIFPNEEESYKTFGNKRFLMTVVGVSAWCLKPQPLVAESPIYEKAAAWCQKRISELPPQDRNRRYFEESLRHIEKRDIRWSIDDPSGLHYTMLVDFAKAWEESLKG